MAAVESRPFFLAGEKMKGGKLKDVVLPSDRSPIARVHFAGPAEVERAIASATDAFSWTRKVATHERSRVCRDVAARLEKERERLALDLAREAGKPISLANAEVGRAVLTFSTAAEEASRIGGEVLNLDVTPDSEGVIGITRRFPIGPVAAITPFNFPLNLVAHKLAPAIASGCPIVLKPASATPLSALNLGAFIIEAGWPKSAISILPCSAADAAPLVEDARLKLITFTGSADVGWGIRDRAGKKRVALELGGNAAAVIDETADLEFAAARCAVGGFAYAGQSCISVQRIFVHWNVKKKFLELLMKKIEGIKVGDIMDKDVLVGPMITEQEAIRVESWVGEAAAGGANILCGGKRDGSYYPPTVITQVDPQMKVSCREIFGPVVVVDSFHDWDDAIARVNNSDFGLQAGVFTTDIGRALAAFEEIEVGGLVVNDMPTYRVDPQPYGGSKDSGNTREGPRYSIETMTEKRLLLIRKR